jgi:hypothetical protein
MSDTNEVTVPIEGVTFSGKTEATPAAPADGDYVMYCPHIAERQNSWYWCEDATFKRPSGASGRVSWMCVCIECELLLKNDPKASVFSNIGVYASTPSPSLNPLPPESDA